MKPTILLAEDDTTLSFVIKDNLEEVGYEVTKMQQWWTGLATVSEKELHICLLDVNMPIRDGCFFPSLKGYGRAVM